MGFGVPRGGSAGRGEGPGRGDVLCSVDLLCLCECAYVFARACLPPTRTCTPAEAVCRQADRLSDRQAGRRTARQPFGRFIRGRFLTVEAPQQPEPRGGRWEEAESPQLPHRAAAERKAARGKRSHPHLTMSTV